MNENDVYKTETYRCMNSECKHEYKGIPGIVQLDLDANHCPKCNSIYVEWVNFQKDWYCEEKNNWVWKRRNIK